MWNGNSVLTKTSFFIFPFPTSIYPSEKINAASVQGRLLIILQKEFVRLQFKGGFYLSKVGFYSRKYGIWAYYISMSYTSHPYFVIMIKISVKMLFWLLHSFTDLFFRFSSTPNKRNLTTKQIWLSASSSLTYLEVKQSKFSSEDSNISKT